MSKKITAYGKIEDGNLELSYLDKFWNAVRSLPNGKYKLTIEKLYRKRSNEQNKFLWGVIYPIVRDGLVEVGYDEFNHDTDCEKTHSLCKYLFLKTEMVNKKTGEIIETVRSTAELTTIETMEYWACIDQWASEYLGVVIPDPDPNYETVKLLTQ